MEITTKNSDLVESVEGFSSKSRFPLRVFSPQLQDFTNQVAKAFSVPVDVVFTVVLVVLGAAIGASVKVRVSKSFEQAVFLWLQVIGETGTVKSPLINYLLKPLKNIQRNKNEKVVIATDATIEALGSSLSKNPKGILLHLDEMTSFYKSFNKYKNGGDDRQQYLNLWNGEDLHIIRATKDNVLVQNPVLSIIGGIQPGLLKNYLDKESFIDGLSPRFLYSDIGRKRRQFRKENEVSEELFGYWEELINKLYSLPCDEPKIITFDETGMWLFEQHYNITAEREEEALEHKRIFMPKFSSYLLRIIGILHVLKCQGKADIDSVIHFFTVRDAAQILYFLEEEVDSLLNKYVFTEDYDKQRQIYSILEEEFNSNASIFSIQEIYFALRDKNIISTNQEIGYRIKALGFKTKKVNGKSVVILSNSNFNKKL